MEKLINKIENCKTMPELDSLRMECVRFGKENGTEGFLKIQKVFIKQKNKLQRVPLSERSW